MAVGRRVRCRRTVGCRGTVRGLLAATSFVVAALAGAAPGTASELPASVTGALHAAGIPPAHAAFAVVPLDGGALRVAVNATQPMNPASTMKLVTTYVALQALGPAYTWHTDVLAASPLAEGVLDGPLWLRGSGDPSLVIERFWLLVQRLRALGVRELRGDLVLDKSAYGADVAVAPTLDGADQRPYNVAPDPLLVNYKALTYSWIPDPEARVARVVASPMLAGVHLPEPVRLVDGPCGDWRARLQADFTDPLAPVLRGAYPLSCGEQSWNFSVYGATDYAGAAFRSLWESSGGAWSGVARDGVVAPAARLLFSVESPPLSEVIREINKFSNNAMARQLFLTLGAEGERAPATLERSARVLRTWLFGHGLAMPELELENGSGLSRVERISAESMARLLVQAWHGPLMPEFAASLPLAGVDGTMKKRPAAAGSAHVKTGLLADARALAGYVRTETGRDYVVVAFVNDANAGATQAALDALLQWVHDHG